MSEPQACLTVDAELLAHTPAVRRSGVDVSDMATGRDGLADLLEMLDSHGVKATFFVVSELAERDPDLVRRLSSAGHEIGSHTHTHRQLSEITGNERREELRRSRRILHEVTGTAIRGFRAPVFDTPADHFDLVAGAGYEYDSSVVPCRRIPGWYGGEHRRLAPGPASAFLADAPDVYELPVAVMPWLRLPLSGLWLRLFGRRYAIKGMQWLAARGLTPVLHVHPWELVDVAAIKGLPRRMYLRTGEWMRETVSVLLSQPFDFRTAGAVVESG